MKEIGRAAVIAVTKARGMEVAGAIDSHSVGEDIGMVLSSYHFLTIYFPCILKNTNPRTLVWQW